MFNRDGDVALSQTDHIMYPGPWLEMLRLPVKENKDRCSTSTTKIVEFFPLCHHFNEAEYKQDTFGCTVHAVCWEFLTCVFGGDKEINRKASRIMPAAT
ncbi:hypothetical protein GX50_00387 [[Emmonsia] crescens]|uniref:Uncharacterized protein n=1 Tax=[Emmonsia] crescens TaxID=73230 RepID=A0A2B7ZVD9_9EURO|nr:hypothetical protein GX50_00387 [Emmonsia crescens]